MKTADQKLSFPLKNTTKENSSIEDIKEKLMRENPTYYSLDPKALEEHSKYEFENLNKNPENYNKEDIQTLNRPTKESSSTEFTGKDEIIERERKEKRDSSRKKERESKKLEDIANPVAKKKKEKEGESSITDKAKSFLKEKGVSDKGKNLLLSRGKDILSGKKSISDLAKSPTSLLTDKNQLLPKGMGSVSSVLNNKGLRDKGIEKLKKIGERKKEQKSTMNVESPELKKVIPETKKEETKPQEETKQEIKKKAEPSPVKKEELVKSEEKSKPSSSGTSTSTSKKEPSIGVSDMEDIKSLLGRIAFLLEGPLSIESPETPFRPDSRRF
jgi:hypothetical protein